MLLVVSHFTLILLLLSLFSPFPFLLLWKNVSHLIIPFSVLPLPSRPLLHLNSATKTHISKQKMTVLLVFFMFSEMLWLWFNSALTLNQLKYYLYASNISVLGYFTIVVLYAREKQTGDGGENVENMWKKKSVYKKRTCTHTYMKSRLMFT